MANPFHDNRTGELHLERQRTRFSGLPERLTMKLGNGAYTAPVVADQDTTEGRPMADVERVSNVIEQAPGLGREELLKTAGGHRANASKALSLLLAEGYVRVEPEGRTKRHYSVRAFCEADDG